jgi:uncharacterized membrane protein YdbT with pleckstrin-like domain
MARAGPKVSRYLLTSEQRVFAVRRHWMALASTFLLFLGFLFGGLLLVVAFRHHPPAEAFAVFFLIFSALWFLWFVLDWYFEEIVVTNRRVLLVTGVLNKKVGIMPLIKVTDLTFEQSLWGRMLGYGTFIVESAGQDQALSRIDYMARPLHRYRQISALLFGTAEMDSDPEDTGRAKHDTAPIPVIKAKKD